MKAFAFALVVLASCLPLQADILVNGNFADGRAHWKGDAKEPDAASGNLLNSPPLSSVVVTLKKDKWTKIYQNFNTHEKKLRYSITFTLSSDYQPDRNQPEMGGANPPPGLDDVDGVSVFFAPGNGTWLGIIARAGFDMSYFFPQPNPKKTDSQTLSGILQGASNADNTDMVLLFIFPPGVGGIDITNIALTGVNE